MGREQPHRRRSRNRPGDRAWRVAFDALGAGEADRRRIRGQIDLAYPVVAGLVAGLMAGVFVWPVLGGTGAVVAAIVVGSGAFMAVAERAGGPRV